MKYIQILILCFFLHCTPKNGNETITLNPISKDTLTHLQSKIDTTDNLFEATFGEGKFIHNHINNFSTDLMTDSKKTLKNKIDSITWNTLIETNYNSLNNPGLNSLFMFSDQNDLYGYNLFTFQTFEHLEEPSIYLVVIDKNKKLINQQLLATIADGCGGISGEMTTDFINDSTFTTTSDFGEIEIGKNKDTWHYEKIITTYKIDSQGQFILLESKTTNRIE